MAFLFFSHIMHSFRTQLSLFFFDSLQVCTKSLNISCCLFLRSTVHFVCPPLPVTGSMCACLVWWCLGQCLRSVFVWIFVACQKKKRHIYIKFFFFWASWSDYVYSTVDEKKKKFPKQIKFLHKERSSMHVLSLSELFFFFSVIYLVARILFFCLLSVWYPCFSH